MSSIGIKTYEIIAFDQWGNETKKDIIVERVMQVAKNDNALEPLNLKTADQKNKNRIALIIGIEEYKNISNANYAKRYQLFIDYVQARLVFLNRILNIFSMKMLKSHQSLK